MELFGDTVEAAQFLNEYEFVTKRTQINHFH